MLYERTLSFAARLVLPLAACLPWLAGCNLMAAPWIMWGQEPLKTIPAAYPHVDGKKVCILVWADSETLTEYPFVQLEVSEHVLVQMKAALKNVSFVPNRSVVDYQKGHPDWDRMDPAAIGALFKADRVLMIELSNYTTREPDSPHLYRGHVTGNVRIYDAGQAGMQPLFRTTVKSVYPENSAGQWGTDDRAIRLAMMETFGRDVANLFHERKEKIR